MPPFLATVAILCPRHCAPMASSCLPPPPAKRGHTWAGSMRWLHCKPPWEGAVPPQGLPTQLDAPRPQQRPPTSSKGQEVRLCWEGGCFSSEGGERCPRLFKATLARPQLNISWSLKASPVKSAMFKRNQQIPRDRSRELAAGQHEPERSAWEGGWRTCACELQGPGEQEQAQEPGGWDGARWGPPPRRPALHRGPRVSVPPSSLAHTRRQPAGIHSSPWLSQ